MGNGGESVKEENGKALSTSFWLDAETKELLRVLCEELGLPRSAVIREAVKRMSADTNHVEIRRLVAELSRVVSGT
jgi:predicted DNA-binding protein